MEDVQSHYLIEKISYDLSHILWFSTIFVNFKFYDVLEDFLTFCEIQIHCSIIFFWHSTIHISKLIFRFEQHILFSLHLLIGERSTNVNEKKWIHKHINQSYGLLFFIDSGEIQTENRMIAPLFWWFCFANTIRKWNENWYQLSVYIFVRHIECLILEHF